jgi:hypothetical protein
MSRELVQPMSLFDAQILFQKFAAFVNVAHAKIDFPEEVFQRFRSNGGRIFPIFLRIVDGRAYVGENYSNNKNLRAGDEVHELNGVSMANWLDVTASHISADTDYIANSLLEFMFPKYLWLELGELDSYELLIQSGAEKPLLIDVNARTQSEMQASISSIDQSFQLDSSSRISKMLNDKVAYLRPGPFYNIEDPTSLWDNTNFKKIIDAAFLDFIKNKAETLIIDLRTNPGGDNSFSDHMLAWVADRPFRFSSKFLIKSSDKSAESNKRRLDSNKGEAVGVSELFAQKYAEVPRGELFNFQISYTQPRNENRFYGDVYVLINRHSYSNAVNVAAIVQDYGFGRVVGEKTSDMATTYGAMETFKLDATGITVSFPKAHIIRPSGETMSDGVTPEQIIETPIIPKPRDTVLETLLTSLKSKI